MIKFLWNVAYVVFALYVVVVCIGIYSEWKACSDIGGTFVRGLFGMECIR